MKLQCETIALMTILGCTSATGTGRWCKNGDVSRFYCL